MVTGQSQEILSTFSNRHRVEQMRIPRIATCGIHLRIITLSGLSGKLSSSNFQSTLYGNFEKAAVNSPRSLADNMLLLTFVPRFMYTNPCVASSKIFCKSY